MLNQGVKDTVIVEAPLKFVWDILVDLNHWGEWNPLYPMMAGNAQVGENLRFTVQLQGMKPQSVTAKIYVCEPLERLEYGVSGMGGLLKTYRFIHLKAVSEGSCQVINGETMSGPLGKLVSRILRTKVSYAMQSMNLALRDKAEGDWARVKDAQ